MYLFFVSVFANLLNQVFGFVYCLLPGMYHLKWFISWSSGVGKMQNLFWVACSIILFLFPRIFSRVVPGYFFWQIFPHKIKHLVNFCAFGLLSKSFWILTLYTKQTWWLGSFCNLHLPSFCSVRMEVLIFGIFLTLQNSLRSVKRVLLDTKMEIAELGSKL